MLDYVRKMLYMRTLARKGYNKVITLQHEIKANPKKKKKKKKPPAYGSVQHGRS